MMVNIFLARYFIFQALKGISKLQAVVSAVLLHELLGYLIAAGITGISCQRDYTR